jgi:hypothetical protein
MKLRQALRQLRRAGWSRIRVAKWHGRFPKFRNNNEEPMNQQIIALATQHITDRINALDPGAFRGRGNPQGELRRWDYAVIIPPFHCIVVIEHRLSDRTFFRAEVISVVFDDITTSRGEFPTPEQALDDGFAVLDGTIQALEQDQKDVQAAEAAEAEKRTLEIAAP